MYFLRTSFLQVELLVWHLILLDMARKSLCVFIPRAKAMENDQTLNSIILIRQNDRTLRILFRSVACSRANGISRQKIITAWRSATETALGCSCLDSTEIEHNSDVGRYAGAKQVRENEYQSKKGGSDN